LARVKAMGGAGGSRSSSKAASGVSSKAASTAASVASSERSSLDAASLGSRSASKMIGRDGRSQKIFGRRSVELPLMQAVWNDTVLVKSNKYVAFDGTFYFPREDLREEHFSEGDFSKTDPKKGVASFLHIHAKGRTHTNAAYFYANPPSAAAEIKNKVAFWKGVPVTPADDDSDEEEEEDGESNEPEARSRGGSRMASRDAGRTASRDGGVELDPARALPPLPS